MQSDLGWKKGGLSTPRKHRMVRRVPLHSTEAKLLWLLNLLLLLMAKQGCLLLAQRCLIRPWVLALYQQV